jgi:hypothetical protein
VCATTCDQRVARGGGPQESRVRRLLLLLLKVLLR